MKKGKVVDIFSRSAMDVEHQDTKANDKRTEELGQYVGSVHKETADAVRSRMQMLNARSMQIETMIQQFEVAYSVHFAEVAKILSLLGVEKHKFNPQTQDIMINENGDIWIVDLPKQENLN